MTLPAGADGLVPGLAVGRERALSGGDTGQAWRVPRTRGCDVLVKRTVAGAAQLEAAGLRWLRDGGIPTPGVLAATTDLLALEWVDPTTPGPQAALRFGRALAQGHSAVAEAFGVPPPPAGARTGWVGAVPVPFGSWPDWPSHYVHDRLRPTAAAARRCDSLSGEQADAVHGLCDRLLAQPALAGPVVAPARIHGDLWAGNLLWQADCVLVIDPAACGGHPETDLAMLQLFGAPFLAEIVAGYESVRPLDDGWQSRIPLHHVFPLLVHAVMFGGHYGAAAARAARTALTA